MTPSSPRTPRKTPTPAFPVDPSQHPPYQSQGVPPPAPGPPRRPPSRWRSRCRGDRGRGTRGQRLRGVRRGWGCRKERGRRPPRPPSSLGTAVMSPGHPQRSPSPAEGVPLPWGVCGGGAGWRPPSWDPPFPQDPPLLGTHCLNPPPPFPYTPQDLFPRDPPLLGPPPYPPPPFPPPPHSPPLVHPPPPRSVPAPPQPHPKAEVGAGSEANPPRTAAPKGCSAPQPPRGPPRRGSPCTSA